MEEPMEIRQRILSMLDAKIIDHLTPMAPQALRAAIEQADEFILVHPCDIRVPYGWAPKVPEKRVMLYCKNEPGTDYIFINLEGEFTVFHICSEYYWSPIRGHFDEHCLRSLEFDDIFLEVLAETGGDCRILASSFQSYLLSILYSARRPRQLN
jgi:hypothetical protein